MLLNEQISPAGEADIPALNELVNSAYRGESSQRGWTSEGHLLGGIRTSEQSLREMFQNPSATLLKYVADGQLLGCVYLEEKKPDLYLGMLTVSPDAQANGIGKKLMAIAEQIAIDKEYQVIAITVISIRHELIAWYERRGFRATGETVPFPDDERFGQPKQPLEFIVMKKKLEENYDTEIKGDTQIKK
ncbi:GNAT family N-acetyltransferase [Spirosoma sp. BT702]|uniref:GNAT family N-acetyltransferase n=1 Tax=Spirosoma profusum TaxID=2771354 RepID=A0A926Y0P0_9BACT|nr:GNAT family N-acetyltransferase [Spirosoma profusum]MBD2704479.1 GNAT family N-acetyltransferase [Spirosoma profusum]